MYKRDIYLDIDDNLNNYIKSVELDSNSRVWHFHLTVDYEPLDLTGKSVQFRAEKPDKTNVLNDCKIVDAEKGVVEVKLTRQVNAIPGRVKCLLKIIGAEGFVLKTKTFVVDVSKALSDDAIVSSEEFGALEVALGKVQDIDNRFAQTNAQLSELANKGTTVEVLERVTKEEIDRQIADGTMANLSIADNSITDVKLKDNSVVTEKIKDKSVTLAKLGDDVELEPPLNSVTLQKMNLESMANSTFDCYTVDLSKANNTTEYQMYGSYVYENPEPQSATDDLECSYVVYSMSDCRVRFSIKLFSNNTLSHSDISGGQAIQGIPFVDLKKGFNVFKTTLKGVNLNYQYYKLMPYINYTKKDGESELKVYLSEVKFDDRFNFAYRDAYSDVKFNPDVLLPQQPMMPKDFGKILEDNVDILEDKIKSYNDKKHLLLHVPNIRKVNGGIGYPTVSLHYDTREKLKDYEYKFPKGTKFKYKIDIKAEQGSLPTIGLQIFQALETKDSSFVASAGYMSLGDVGIIGKDTYTYEHTLAQDTSFTVKEAHYVKLFLNTTYQSGVDFVGELLYSEMDIILPNGESIFDPIATHNSSSLEPAYLTYKNDKVVLYGFLQEELSKIDVKLEKENEKLLDLIADSKRVPSRWTGKSYVSVGDSITWQHEKPNYTPDKSPLKGYQYYVNNRLGVSNFVNEGVSGMTMAKYEGWNNSFISKYQSIQWLNYDLVTIALGTNDHANGGGCLVGDIDSTDISTYCGAYNTVLEHIFKTNPKIRVVLMTPFQKTSMNNVNSKGQKLIDFVDAVVKLGEKWSCPVFDCYRVSGWNKSTFSTYTVDGLHGSADGFESVGIPLGEFLAMN